MTNTNDTMDAILAYFDKLLGDVTTAQSLSTEEEEHLESRMEYYEEREEARIAQQKGHPED